MRALLILIFVISFSAKIMVLDGKDSDLNEIDAQLLEAAKNSEKLDEVFQDFFGSEAKSKTENATIISVFFENVREEAADLYVYRLAELKSIQIGAVSRLLKEVAVDCLLNYEQTGFTIEDMNKTVRQKLSTNQIINYQVGDRPYSSTCDYQEKCSYKCAPDANITEDSIILDTYNENFIMMNVDKITSRKFFVTS